MRSIARALLVAACALMLAAPVVAEEETPGSIQKELFPKYKKAQAEGKDLGVAGEEYKAGQEAMRNGLTDEALEHFKKAKAAWPAQ
jgi:ABC-type sugar transport system substrate-binding protein